MVIMFLLIIIVQIIENVNIDKIIVNRFLFKSVIIYDSLYIMIFIVINDTIEINNNNL